MRRSGIIEDGSDGEQWSGRLPSAAGWVGRLLTVALLWVILTEGELKNLVLAGAVVVLVTVAGARTIPPGSMTIDPRGLVRFVLYFLRQSVHAGIDVARRAFREPAVPRAGVVEYTPALPPGIPRHLFVAAIGLFPGSIAVSVRGDVVRVHVLDRAADLDDQLGRLERHIADLCGVALEPPAAGEGRR